MLQSRFQERLALFPGLMFDKAKIDKGCIKLYKGKLTSISNQALLTHVMSDVCGQIPVYGGLLGTPHTCTQVMW